MVNENVTTYTTLLIGTDVVDSRLNVIQVYIDITDRSWRNKTDRETGKEKLKTTSKIKLEDSVGLVLPKLGKFCPLLTQSLEDKFFNQLALPGLGEKILFLFLQADAFEDTSEDILYTWK